MNFLPGFDSGKCECQFQKNGWLFYNGRTLTLIVGQDSFTVLLPEPTTMKLYMPLTADVFNYNEYGDMEDESYPLDGRELLSHQGDISEALAKYRMSDLKINVCELNS